MDEQGCFHSFVTLLTKRPHLAESLLRWLDPRDIGNCLKTSKDFRTLILVALQWSGKIQTMLDDGVSRRNLTSGQLNTRQYGPIQREVWCKYYSYMNGFAIDGSLWICGPKPEDSSIDGDDDDEDDDIGFNVGGGTKGILSIYYLDNDQANKSRSMPIRYKCRLMANILPNSGVIVQDHNRIKVLRKENGCKLYELVQDFKSHMVDMRGYPRAVFGRDCVLQCEKMGGAGEDLPSWKLTFCDVNGHFITGHSLKMTSRPDIVIQKVIFNIVNHRIFI